MRQIEGNGLRILCHHEWPNDCGDIDVVVRRHPDGTPFHTAAWQQAAWQSHSPGGRMRIFTVHRNDELVSFLPMRLSHDGILYSIGQQVSDYLDPLLCADAWQLIISRLSAICEGNVARIELHNIRASARCRAILPELAGSMNASFEETLITQSMRIALPSSWEAYLGSLAGHQRKEIRRKLKNAEEGGARLIAADADSAMPMLIRSLDLMETGNAEKQESVKYYLRPILLDAGPTMTRAGQLNVSELSIGGTIAASLVEFASGAGRMLYNCGVNPAHREWSPGIVAMAMSIRDAITRADPVYDLLRGSEPYKTRLGAAIHPIYQITITL